MKKAAKISLLIATVVFLVLLFTPPIWSITPVVITQSSESTAKQSSEFIKINRITGQSYKLTGTQWQKINNRKEGSLITDEKETYYISGTINDFGNPMTISLQNQSVYRVTSLLVTIEFQSVSATKTNTVYKKYACDTDVLPFSDGYVVLPCHKPSGSDFKGWTLDEAYGVKERKRKSLY